MPTRARDGGGGAGGAVGEPSGRRAHGEHDALQAESDRDVGAAVHSMGRGDDGHRLEPGGCGLSGHRADHDRGRAAQGPRRDGAQGAGAAEHHRGVAAVGQHQRAQVLGRPDRVGQRRAQDLGDHQDGGGGDGAVDEQRRPAGAGDPAGEQGAGDQRHAGADEQEHLVDAEPVELRAREGGLQPLGGHEQQRGEAQWLPRAGGRAVHVPHGAEDGDRGGRGDAAEHELVPLHAGAVGVAERHGDRQPEEGQRQGPPRRRGRSRSRFTTALRAGGTPAASRGAGTAIRVRQSPAASWAASSGRENT